jgi:hypothetical protein
MPDVPAETLIWGLRDTIQKRSIMTPQNLLHAYTIISRYVHVVAGKKYK